jgi:hypothetical protein
MTTEQIAFELERFRWAAPDRLELTGRWFGVRGLRFVRPELIVSVDGEPRRVVAVLDHKPWAAHEGEDWTAAFAWRAGGGEVGGAELSVGPGIRVELPPPGGDAPPSRRPAGRAVASRSQRPRAETHEAGPASELLRLNQTLAAAREERDAAHAAVEAERERAAALAAELEAARDEHARAAAELAAERDDAVRARDAATLAETAARRALESARAERDAALRERKAAREAAARAEAARPESPARAAAAPPPLSTPPLLRDPVGRAGLALWLPRIVAVALVLGLLAAALLVLGAL